MVKQATSRRTLSRSFKHSSRAELSPPLAPWTSPSPPPLDQDPSPVVDWDSRTFPDQVYLDAAAIFRNAQQDKAAGHRLIAYGRKSKVSALKVKDDAWQRRAYELAFNALKYQEMLEDIMIDSSFYSLKLAADEQMSLVAVMLYDLQDRNFLQRERPANRDTEEEVAQVREVENCLLRLKTKLAAALARCRIKHNLLSIDCMLPESVRLSQERGSNLPIYAWINTLRTSAQEASEVLESAGFSRVNSVGRLHGQTFCGDLHCDDLLVFPACAKRELNKTSLLKRRRLVIQDKVCCVGPWALRSWLVPDGDVMMAGSLSAAAVAHTAAIVHATHPRTHDIHHPGREAHGSVRVLVCVGECSSVQREELQEVLGSMGCSNVKLLPESLHTLDVCDTRLQKVQLILLTPQCSLSAVSNPVEYLLQENGDKELLQDLSQGSVSQSRLHTLISGQKRDLRHALGFPKVRVVVYSTCSSLPEENEDVVRSALTQTAEDNPKLQPFTLSRPSFPLCDKEDEEKKTHFFRLETSDQSNGCFLAVFTRKAKPEVPETPQEVIARATASGLLDGILPAQSSKKKGRGRPIRKGVRRARYQNQEAKANGPATMQERTKGKSKPSPKNASSTFSSLSSTSLTTGHASLSSSTGLTVPHTSPASLITAPSSSSTPSSISHTLSAATTDPNTLSTSFINKITITSITKSPRAPNRTAAGLSVPPPAPPRGRQEVLHPVPISFPPAQFPDLCPVYVPVKIKPPPMSHQSWRSWSRPAPATHSRLTNTQSYI